MCLQIAAQAAHVGVGSYMLVLMNMSMGDAIRYFITFRRTNHSRELIAHALRIGSQPDT